MGNAANCSMHFPFVNLSTVARTAGENPEQPESCISLESRNNQISAMTGKPEWPEKPEQQEWSLRSDAPCRNLRCGRNLLRL